MGTNKPLRYCPNCLGINYKSKEALCPPGMSIPILKMHHYVVYGGFVADSLRNTCPTCDGELIPMKLTEIDWEIIQYTSLDQEFIFAMDELKQNDIIEFSSRMSQFKETEKEALINQIDSNTTESQSNTPKCPTCGSTNIKKISGTKRFVSTGIFGLGSSNVGKSFECCNCGYKW